MRHTLRSLKALMWKDIQTELRGGRFVLSSLAFGILLILVVGMALDGSSRLPASFAAGLLWLNLFFSTAISMGRHDAKDREMGGILGMLLTPVDRSLIFYAKWMTTLLLVVVAELGMLGAFFIILNEPLPVRLGAFALVMLAGTMGLTGIGTFLATLTANSSMRDILIPLLLFPLCIPMFLSLIQLTVFSLGAAAQTGVWLEVLIGYLVVLAVLPWLLYEPLMEV